MAAINGNDNRLFVQSATSGTFNAVAGQRDCNKTDSRPTFNKGSKEADVDVQGIGKRNITVTLQGVVDLPDTNGLTRIKTLSTGSTAEVYQIRKAPYSDSDIVFACSMLVSQFDDNLPYNGERGYSITLVPAATPSTDTL